MLGKVALVGVKRRELYDILQGRDYEQLKDLTSDQAETGYQARKHVRNLLKTAKDLGLKTVVNITVASWRFNASIGL